jgi:hypothetical protein
MSEETQEKVPSEPAPDVQVPAEKVPAETIADEKVPDERVREIARTLREPKIGLLQKLADHIGMDKLDELFQRALEIEAAGGMYTANNKRRRTPGGVLFQLTRDLMTPRERRKIFREKRPVPEGGAPPPPKKAPKPAPEAPRPPTPEQVALLIKAAAAIPPEKKGAAVVKVTVIGRPKQVKRLDTCVLVVLAPKAPGTLPKGLPPVPDTTTATVAVFIATKQWAKVEPSLKQDPTDEIIVEGYPANDPKNQITAVWAQSCTTKLIQRAVRQQKGQDAPDKPAE